MRRYFVIAAILITTQAAQAGEISSAVQKAKGNSRSYSDYQVSDQVRNGEAQADAASKTADLVNSEAFQQRVNTEKKRLRQEVFGDVRNGDDEGYYADLSRPKKGLAPKLAQDERVYIFVSSSIPEATLRTYAADIEKTGDPHVFMVMRGFVGGMKKFAPTMQFISRILLKDPSCSDSAGCPAFGAAIEIDPNLYRRFQPQQVPAIVYARGVNPVDAERSEGDPTNVRLPANEKWWMMYGDASLGYMVGRINEEAKSSGLGALADALIR